MNGGGRNRYREAHRALYDLFTADAGISYRNPIEIDDLGREGPFNHARLIAIAVAVATMPT